ncbi:hypothetical protein G6O67_006121 [Ophiocordyceps sinensis]|uniref:Uncharacterized protein n=2 Tax=Ophiocordyceps sinensis TaxID=72228 RepID=A0A8H4PP32_9HYPO|nr:FMI2 protein [Ophiocordyceps sinensis CO18]KAF4505990.1 hypothetical protein G6O67_006121 [Ophiocordyceps sinensis]
MERSTPVSQDAVRMAPYSYRAPSPPFIRVPMPGKPRGPDKKGAAIELVPSLENVDVTQVSGRDLDIITRGKTQQALASLDSWRYELRRQAQPVLDYLYLGPTSVVRDHDFLRREAITMVLLARDVRLGAANIVSVDRAVSALGIVGQYVDIDGPAGMTRAYPQAVRLINDHMLAVHDAQPMGDNGQHPLPMDRHGKVLVVCESGNDRSAAIVAAYIMAMFGQGMLPAIQFTTTQRFCCTFEEHVKRSLQAWDDILTARRVVASDPHDPEDMNVDMAWETSPPAAASTGPGARTKRGIDDMLLDTMEDGQGEGNPMSDADRFVDRDACVPFRDVDSIGEPFRDGQPGDELGRPPLRR